MTCRSQVLPTMVTTGVSASSSAFRHGSSSGVAVLAAGHAERGDLGVLERQLADLLEILEVLRVGKRIAAFDEVDAELVELARDEQLVLQREVDAFALAAVAERGVVNEDAGHRNLGRNKKPRGIMPGAVAIVDNGESDPGGPIDLGRCALPARRKWRSAKLRDRGHR